MVISDRDTVGAQLEGHSVFVCMGNVLKLIIVLVDLADGNEK